MFGITVHSLQMRKLRSLGNVQLSCCLADTLFQGLSHWLLFSFLLLLLKMVLKPSASSGSLLEMQTLWNHP